MAWPSDDTVLNDSSVHYGLRYVHPDTSETVHVTSGPWLDVSRQTPYGTLNPGLANDDAWPALQWAFDNCREPDPTARISPEDGDTLAGGPRGCFNPIMPSGGSGATGVWKCDGSAYSNSQGTHTGTLYVRPGVHGFIFKGTGMGPGSTTGGINNATRIHWGPNTNTQYAIMSQGINVRIADLSAVGRYDGSPGARNAYGIVSTNVADSDDLGFSAVRNAVVTQTNVNPARDLNLERVALGGFDTCVSIGLESEDIANDYTRIIQCQVMDCDVGVHLLAVFNQQVIIDNLRERSSMTNLILIEGGFTGEIKNLNPGYSGFTAYIKIDGISSNASFVKIMNTKFDDNFGDTDCFLDVTIPSSSGTRNHVILDVANETNYNAGTAINPNMIKAKGGVFLRLNNWKGVPGIQPSKNANDIAPIIVVDGMIMKDAAADDPEAALITGGNGHDGLKLRDCLSQTYGMFDWDSVRGQVRLSDSPTNSRAGQGWVSANPSGDLIGTVNVSGTVKSGTVLSNSNMTTV